MVGRALLSSRRASNTKASQSVGIWWSWKKKEKTAEEKKAEQDANNERKAAEARGCKKKAWSTYAVTGCRGEVPKEEPHGGKTYCCPKTKEEKKAEKEKMLLARLAQEKEDQENEEKRVAATERGCEEKSRWQRWVAGCPGDRPNQEPHGGKTYCCPKTT